MHIPEMKLVWSSLEMSSSVLFFVSGTIQVDTIPESIKNENTIKLETNNQYYQYPAKQVIVSKKKKHSHRLDRRLVIIEIRRILQLCKHDQL